MRPHLTSKNFRGIKTNRMKLAQKDPVYSFLLLKFKWRMKLSQKDPVYSFLLLSLNGE